MNLSRREFVLSLTSAGLALPLLSCKSLPLAGSTDFKPLKGSNLDKLILAPGLNYKVLLTAGQALSENLFFGNYADYNAFFTLPEKTNEALLFTSHEGVPRKLLLEEAGLSSDQDLTASHIENEMLQVGASISHIRFDGIEKKWKLIAGSKYNRRISALTPIPFSGGVRIQNSSMSLGTLSNCAGGVTPWGTALSGEENYADYVGDVFYYQGRRKVSPSRYNWEHYKNMPPEHYGWVVEIDPFTGRAQKLVSLGRFSHEGATCVKATNGRVVVYMGDDAHDQCVYKFISDSTNSLTSGTLFVANFTEQRWIALDIEKNLKLRTHFSNQLELLINARKAAHLVGGTPLNRPEDIEFDTQLGCAYVALTGNYSKGDNFGSILQIFEKDASPLALEFTIGTFSEGGLRTGFACPDNLMLDQKLNLWVTSDIADPALNNPPYQEFGNNSLYYMPTHGANRGRALQIASAPIGSELTGPYLSHDQKTLFLSVQHPDPNQSRWPHGKALSSVVAISGPTLEQLTL